MILQFGGDGARTQKRRSGRIVTNFHVRVLPPTGLFNTLKQTIPVATFEGEETYANLSKFVGHFQSEMVDLLEHGIQTDVGHISTIRLWGYVFHLIIF